MGMLVMCWTELGEGGVDVTTINHEVLNTAALNNMNLNISSFYQDLFGS